MNPPPIVELRNLPICGKRLNVFSEIDRSSWIEWSQQRHDSSPCTHVRRRILREALQEGNFHGVGIYGTLPAAEDFRKTTDMVEMAVRQQNGRRSGLAEVEVRPAPDSSRRSRQTRIYQHPTVGS